MSMFAFSCKSCAHCRYGMECDLGKELDQYGDASDCIGFEEAAVIQYGGFIEIDDSMKLEPISLDVFIDDLVRSAMNEKLKGDKDE